LFDKSESFSFFKQLYILREFSPFLNSAHSISRIPIYRLPQSALFLEIVKILADEANYTKHKVTPARDQKLLPHLLATGRLYEGLGNLLLTIVSILRGFASSRTDLSLLQPTQNRSHPLLPASISLSLLPFKTYPAPPPPATKSALSIPSRERASALISFASHILTVPLLSSRLAPKELSNLNKSIPFFDIIVELSTHLTQRHAQEIDVERAAHLLANLVSFANSRIASIDKGKVLAAWLSVTNVLMDKLPLDAFKEEKIDRKGKGKEIETIVLEDSDDELVGEDEAEVNTDGSGDIEMDDASTTVSTTPRSPPLDPRTRSLLLSLSSRSYTLTLLGLSTRYPTSTRLPLASYLCSLLAILPPASKDSLLNTLLYAPAASGLLRELYRTFLRTGPLGKLLAQAKREKSTVVMAALSDKQYKEEWPVVALVLEMYSRCLLTMGDDEFYAENAGGGMGRGGGGGGSEGRNPLGLDEVVGLSAMARNAAFAMYWQEGSASDSSSGQELKRKVMGLRTGYEELRSLLTRFLQQVHARE